MLSKKELMLGNKIYYKDRVVKVVEINNNTVIVSENGERKTSEETNLDPIALSDQVLRDLGFIDRNMTVNGVQIFDKINILYSSSNQEDFYNITLSKAGTNFSKWKLEISDKNYSVICFGFVNSYHELQNFIRLSIGISLN